MSVCPTSAESLNYNTNQLTGSSSLSSVLRPGVRPCQVMYEMYVTLISSNDSLQENRFRIIEIIQRSLMAGVRL